MNLTVCALLAFAIAATACSQPAAGPQELQEQAETPYASPMVAGSPAAVAKAALPSSTPFPTATPGPVSGSTAVHDNSSPTPEATAAPGPGSTPTTTSAPMPPPTPAATDVTLSPEEYDRAESFMENFKSISYEASLELPDRFTDSDGPFTANVSGWMMTNGPSQMFAQIEMTEPVERTFEVVTLNSFDIYLKDLDEGRWYFIPENSDTDSGPLEDVLSLPFLALGFAIVPRGDLEPVQEGYVWKVEDPSWGSITASYDQEHVLKGITRADTDGREIMRARFFGLNETHDIIPHEKGKLLPDSYWDSR